MAYYGIVVLMIVLTVVSAGFNFGYDNSYTCHCENNTRCDTVTGDCSNGCFEGWSGPIFQLENKALHSDFVNQRYTFIDNLVGFGPKRAVDGNIYSCSFSGHRRESWWLIDLQQQYTLRYMTLYYGGDYDISVSVHINDEMCFQHPRSTPDYPHKYSVDCGRTLTGRYVNISTNILEWDFDLDYDSDIAQLLDFIALCEVEIVVCARGTYGSDCNNFCHCSNLEECDVKTGKCPNGCQLGWYGDNCNTAKCDDGYYILGESCVRCTCGDNCNSDTGVCDGECHEHCIDQKCDDMKRCTEGCSVGYYGDYCDLPCHSNCNGNICDGNGNCINGCIDGYHGRICNEQCPVNCTRCNILSGDCLRCIKPWYGDACTHQCSDCVNGNCHANGTCINGCFNGRYGELCQYNCSSVCKRPSNNTNICQQITGKCIEGCRDGFKGHICEEAEATRPESRTDSPTTDSPTTDSPTTNSPTTDSPTTDSPKTDSPTTDSPTTDSPTTDSPTTDSPTTDSPTTDSPTTDSPTTDSPTTDPPTTVSQTTNSPTTDSPTTKSPTTDSPTTDLPTTDSPTTYSSTTGFNFGYEDSYTCHCEDNTRCDTVTGDCSNGCFEGWGGPICQQENIALHSDFVNQSSILRNNLRYGPKRAVDGDKDTFSKICDKGGAWWFIDLQQQYTLRYMKLIYRAYHKGLASNISVSVHINDELCFQQSDRKRFKNKLSVDCGRTLIGRSVNISFNAYDWVDDGGYIRLYEMEIFVCARGTYGSDCNNFCHCSNLEECDVKTGKCPNGCQLG